MNNPALERKPLGVRLRWLSVSCYEIDCGGTHIVTDPHITRCPTNDLTWEIIEQCDMIALTHAHWDHATDLPPLMERFDPLLLCPEQSMVSLAQWLDANPARIYPMYPDVEVNFGSVKVRPIYTRHIKSGNHYIPMYEAILRNPVACSVPGMAITQRIAPLNCRSYLFTLKNGTKILFWLGNLTKEQYPLCTALKPDIVIVQRALSEWGITRRAEFAAATGAQVVLPHHHLLFPHEPTDAVPLFRDEMNRLYPDRTFIAPRHGEWINL